MRVSLIAAMASNRAIGLANKLPWSLPEDLKRFRAVTRGHAVIMGRKTFESIGRPLPDRRNYVVTRNPGYSAPGAQVAGSLAQALARCADDREFPADEVFVIGGAEVYALAMPRADRLYLTLLKRAVEGDAFFPEWPTNAYREISREDRLEPEPFSFVVLDRA